MKKHITTIHDCKKPFQCTICSKQVTSKASLSKHIQIIHEGKKPILKCDTCSKVFAEKRYLRFHIQRKLCGEIFCQDPFPAKSNLKQNQYNDFGSVEGGGGHLSPLRHRVQ